MSKKHRTYTTEFKAEAIKLIETNQGNVSETAKQLGISMQTLSNWSNKAKTGTLAGIKQYSPDLNAWWCSKKYAYLKKRQRGIIRLYLNV